MYHSVLLVPSKQKLVLPTKWVNSIDVVQACNVGVSKTKYHKVFYYKDVSVQPDFELPIRVEFDENIPACYYAQIKSTTGNKN